MTIDGDGTPDTFTLRLHRPGDMGTIISRHGALYAKEHGWDIRFEVVVARLAADIIEQLDADRERFWIAESNRTSEFLGSIAVVKNRQSTTTAQLRLLLVEDTARGMGLGTRLIEECVAFARSKGYLKVTLSTYSFLEGARRLYKRAGFAVVHVDIEREEYGKRLVNEVWELVL